MLIRLRDAIRRYNMKIRGIIHIGAHYGEEHDDYLRCRVQDIIYIEPGRAAFEELKKRFYTNGHVAIYPYAMGAFNGTAILNTETENAGQSNSILKPKKHLQEHPNITFQGTPEMVEVRRLDDLEFNRLKYNMLMLDVQGYELEVLKGGVETLKSIDYIYTEVNRREMYEDCAQIEDLDGFLSDFKRVETKWASENLGWGDSIYKRFKY